jgi:hypothetical protein
MQDTQRALPVPVKISVPSRNTTSVLSFPLLPKHTHPIDHPQSTPYMSTPTMKKRKIGTGKKIKKGI